jgi:hypothetical protein
LAERLCRELETTNLEDAMREVKAIGKRLSRALTAPKMEVKEIA